MSNIKLTQANCPKCNEPMEVIEYYKAYDWDGNLHTFNFLAYKCSTCYDYMVNQHGEKVTPPIPTGYLTAGKRRKCPNCGMLLKSSPGSSIFYEDKGHSIHVPYFGAKCFLCGRACDRNPHIKGRTKNQIFKNHISIPQKVQNEWHVDFCDFMDSQPKTSGSPDTFKFAYSPKIKEFIVFQEIQALVNENTNINNPGSSGEERRVSYEEAIKHYGSESHEYYIPGRAFRNRYRKPDKIFLKKHQNIDWMMETHFLLRRMGVKKEVPLIWRNENL